MDPSDPHSTPLPRRLHPRYGLNKLINGNLGLFEPSQRRTLRILASKPSSKYLLQHWPRPGVRDSEKRAFVAALCSSASEGPTESVEGLREGRWAAGYALA